MLQRGSQRKLATYLAAMVFLNGFVAWHSRRGIPSGYPDFSSFYTAARIIHDGNAARLYDGKLQETVQRSFASAAVAKRSAILPYNHPPIEALLFAPLGRFSYLTAYLLWLVVNLGLLIGLVLLLRRHFTILGKEPIYLWLLGCFGFYPIVVALLQGQDSILLLFCYSMAFLSLRHKADWRAGAWLGLGLCKFQMVIPFVFPFFLLRRGRLILGFLSVAAILIFAGFLAVGWSGSLSYPRYIMETEQYIWGGMPNLRGLLFCLVPKAWFRAARALLVVCSAALLGAVTYAWSKAYSASSASRERAFALSSVATVLLSYHLYLHDLSVLFLAILIVFELACSRPAARSWVDVGVYVCMTALFCSPLYIVLSLKNQQNLQILAGILLVFFLVLMKAASAEAQPPDAVVFSAAPNSKTSLAHRTP